MTKDFKNRDVIQYFACKTFVEMSPKDRFNKLRMKDLCHQCLAPGAYLENDKRNFHRNGKCYSKFVCKDKLHSTYSQKKHVLVCKEHKHDNQALFERYKTEIFLNKKQPLEDFSKQMRLSYHCEASKIITFKEVKKTAKAPLYVRPPLRQLNQGAAFRSGRGYAEKSTRRLNKNKQKALFICFRELE